MFGIVFYQIGLLLSYRFITQLYIHANSFQFCHFVFQFEEDGWGSRMLVGYVGLLRCIKGVFDVWCVSYC